MRLDSDWGVIQKLHIEGDTIQALRAGIMAAMVEHKKITHFKVTENDGGNRLSLCFYGGAGMAQPLPFPLESVDSATDFTRQWLEKVGKWPKERPDTDGDVEQGFAIQHDYHEVVCHITPIWIVYGK